MTGRTNNTNNHAQVELAVRRSRSRKMITNANTTLVINPTTNNIVKIVPKNPKFITKYSYSVFHQENLAADLLNYASVTNVKIALKSSSLCGNARSSICLIVMFNNL